MGFRFRRSVRIIPGIRLNFSKSGVSTSIGGRGATINFSKRGTKTTVGLPGSGLSYSTMVPKDHATPHPVETMHGERARNQANGCFTLLVIGLVAALGFSIKAIVSSGPSALPPPQAKVEVETRYVTAKGLNCRSAPSRRADRVALLTHGQKVPLGDAASTNGWVQVVSDAGKCWVLEARLSKVPQ